MDTPLVEHYKDKNIFFFLRYAIMIIDLRTISQFRRIVRRYKGHVKLLYLFSL